MCIRGGTHPAAIPRVPVNSPGLRPPYSSTLDVQLEFYTRPAGTFSLGWFRKRITNYIINEVTTIEPGDDNGFEGQYAGYVLNTQDNGGRGEFEGLEASLRRGLRPQLSFLPETLPGWVCPLYTPDATDQPTDGSQAGGGGG